MNRIHIKNICDKTESYLIDCVEDYIQQKIEEAYTKMKNIIHETNSLIPINTERYDKMIENGRIKEVQSYLYEIESHIYKLTSSQT